MTPGGGVPGRENDLEKFRREAMGAFAHEIRTPLTSIRMVLELARREGADDRLVLDGELARMLNTSVDDLQHLADDLQESSRLERGKAVLGRGPTDLGAALEAAAEIVAPRVTLVVPPGETVEGPWDAPHLVRALAGFAEAANRVGNGGGVVRVTIDVAPATVRVQLASGEPGGEPKDIAADCGFSFFRARLFIMANGGQVEWERAERYFSVTAILPRE